MFYRSVHRAEALLGWIISDYAV